MKNILEFFEDTVSHYPENIAVSDGKEELSFGALADISKAAASSLLKRGFKNEAVVIFMKKSGKALCALISSIYAGLYYVPMDDSIPSLRRRQILETVSPRLVICDNESFELVKSDAEGIGSEIIIFDEPAQDKTDEILLESVRAEQIDTDPVYLVFTSGSSGVPKGVLCAHRSLIDYAEQITGLIKPDSESVFGLQAPFYVDACMKEILSMFCCGSKIEIIPHSLFSFPFKLLEFLNNKKVSNICWVSSALIMISSTGCFDELRPMHLKTVCFGSEVLPPAEFSLWRAACPSARFINLYGPTEATGMSFFYEIPENFPDKTTIPIGRPFKNTRFILLADDNTKASKGETGEICILGAGLSPGYYGDFGRTEQSFTQNPINKLWPEKIYRTGDLAFENADGELVFVARKDRQIKHMGYRIELDEIESLCKTNPGISLCSCLWDGLNSIIALFFTGNLSERELRSALRSEMPPYMMPQKIIRLERMPMMTSGKIDRKRLESLYKTDYQELCFGRNN